MVRFLKLLVLVPIALVILTFAIANRTVVAVSFDPFSTAETSAAFMSAPLFLVLFVTLMIGVLIGGVATWFTQGSNRRNARVARDEAEHWQLEARRLRERHGVGGTESNGLIVR